MRCEEARSRLLTDATDPQASEHLERCSDCFAVLEMMDAIVPILVAARPAPAPVPARMAARVLDRWRAGPSRPHVALTALLAAMAVAAAVLIEGVAGAEPARLAALAGAGSAVLDVGFAALSALQSVRAAAIEVPGLLAALSLATIAVCGLWIRFVLGLPNWRLA